MKMLPRFFTFVAAFSCFLSTLSAQEPDSTAGDGAGVPEEAETLSTREETESAESSALPATVVTSAPPPTVNDRAPVRMAPPRLDSTFESPGPVVGEVLPDTTEQPSSSNFLPEFGIEVLRIEQPQDIVRYTPNQFATDSGSRSFGDVYASRGLTNTVFFGAPATTVYVDDVPFGETFTYAQDLGPVNSVEVFRGPRPTLVGRNVYGGLINVRSRRPGDFLEGSMSYDYGSYDAHDFDAWVMGPINEKLGFRLGGGLDRRDGYLFNPTTGRRVDNQEHGGIHGGLFFQPAPGWEISLTAGYDEFDDGAPRLTSLDRTTGFYTVTSDVMGEQFRTTNHQALRVQHEEGSRRFLSVTSHRGFDLDPFTSDLDFSAAPGGFTTLKQSQEIWSQELRWSDDDPNSAWAWNAGLYGSTSRIQGWGFRQFPIPVGGGVFAFNDEVTIHTIDEDAFAAYGAIEHRPSERVSIHAGGRIDYVKRSIVRDKTQTLIPPPVVPRLGLEEDWIHFTPTVGVDWQVDENVLLFAKTSYAFKPGGFSAYVDNPDFVPFDEEKVWATEAGVRATGFDGRLDTSLVAFYNAVDDYQVERGLSMFTTDYAVFNAEEAEIYGFEFENRFEICPSLDFHGSVGWTHARLTEYTDPVSGASLDGSIPPFVPEFDAVAALDYHLDCGFFARLEYLAVGETWFDDFNRPAFRQGGYGLINASVGWRGENWNVSLYGANLGDKEYYTNMNTDVRTGAVGVPRIYGVRAGFSF